MGSLLGCKCLESMDHGDGCYLCTLNPLNWGVCSGPMKRDWKPQEVLTFRYTITGKMIFGEGMGLASDSGAPATICLACAPRTPPCAGAGMRATTAWSHCPQPQPRDFAIQNHAQAFGCASRVGRRIISGLGRKSPSALISPNQSLECRAQ